MKTKEYQQYQPKTGEPCGCRRGTERDNCPSCEGTGQRIDFKAIRERPLTAITAKAGKVLPVAATKPSKKMTRAQLLANFRLLTELSPRNTYEEYRQAVNEIAAIVAESEAA